MFSGRLGRVVYVIFLDPRVVVAVAEGERQEPAYSKAVLRDLQEWVVVWAELRAAVAVVVRVFHCC